MSKRKVTVMDSCIIIQLINGQRISRVKYQSKKVLLIWIKSIFVVEYYAIYIQCTNQMMFWSSVLSPYAFSICDTTGPDYEDYQYGGIARQVKTSSTLIEFVRNHYWNLLNLYLLIIYISLLLCKRLQPVVDNSEVLFSYWS